MPSTTAQAPRACDRCHALKERCLWPRGNTACDRCVRLDQPCLVQRPARKPGRRPAASRTRPAQANVSDAVLQPMAPQASLPLIMRQWNPLPGMRPVQQMFASDDYLPSFLVAPTFGHQQRNFLLSLYVSHSTTFVDAFFAVALAWFAGPDQLENRYQRASSALATLRSMRVEDQEDVATCLALGAALQTVALKLGVEDIRSIARHTLGLVKPYYDLAGHSQPDTHRFLTCLIKSDLLNCLLTGQAPLLRYKPPTCEGYVDQYFGVSTSLLPLMHDMFELSHALSHADESDIDSIIDAIDHVKQEVSEWQPAIPPRFSETYTSTEVAVMLCQAQVLRTTALLAIHHLTSPYGTDEDAIGLLLAESILTQLEMTYLATQKSVRSIEMSYLLACLELRSEVAKRLWLDRAEYLTGASSREREYMKVKIKEFWDVQEIRHQDIYLYNLNQAWTGTGGNKLDSSSYGTQTARITN